MPGHSPCALLLGAGETAAAASPHEKNILTTIRELELSQLEQLHQTALNTKQGYATAPSLKTFLDPT